MKVVTADLIRNKRVIIRLDLDVPVDDNLVTDTTRLTSVLPTLTILKEAQQVVIIGHFGRPGGTVVENMRLEPVAAALRDLIGADITYLRSWNDTLIQESLAQHKKWYLLENVRFEPGEEANSPEFAQQLAHYGELFIFEAFAVAHREAASTVGITHYLPTYAGLRVAKEVETLSQVLKQPHHPFLAIIGGVKVETKLPVIHNLSKIADTVFVAGKLIKEIHDQHLTFPANVEIATESGYDIDSNSQKRLAELVGAAQLVVWNGPPGKFEDPTAWEGTKALAQALAQAKARKIIGGGETIKAATTYGIDKQIDFISVGGGAMLDFLAGLPLPALQALS